MTKQNDDVRYTALGLDGAWDVYRKLSWEIDHLARLAASPVAPGPTTLVEAQAANYMAINAASSAWSLVEWLWFEVEFDAVRRAKGTSLLGATSECLDEWKHAARSTYGLRECYNICHAVKHAQLNRFSPMVSTSTHVSILLNDAGDPRLMWGSDVVSTDQDGVVISVPVAELLAAMKAWWSRVLIDLDVADLTDVVPEMDQVERHRLNKPIPRGGSGQC